MPSRTSYSDFNVNLSDLDGILSSPERPSARSSTQVNTRKRRRVEDDNDTDTADGNVITVAKRLAVSEKLSGDQIEDLESFLKASLLHHLEFDLTQLIMSASFQDSALGRAGRVFITLKKIENNLNAVVTKQETWKVSATLKQNINHYVAAASLSVTIQAYKNDRTTTLIMQKIRDMNMELPATFDQDVAAQSALKKAVEEALTQRRSTVKKMIRASSYDEITKQTWVERKPGSACQSIIELTQKLIKGTQCHITPELCAWVAIFRYAYKSYVDTMGQDYWGRVDATLQKIRKDGNNDKKEIARIVKKILTLDRNSYGEPTSYKMPEYARPSALQVDIDQRVNDADGLGGTEDDVNEDDEVEPANTPESGSGGDGNPGGNDQGSASGSGGMGGNGSDVEVTHIQ
ncbi:hypothetical protein PQX77_001448 [Marasmius sp. AFHP31]|nr:hypothetical protein PQX77_001448 [Marasmius sp. AFHP31]